MRTEGQLSLVLWWAAAMVRHRDPAYFLPRDKTETLRAYRWIQYLLGALLSISHKHESCLHCCRPTSRVHIARWCTCSIRQREGGRSALNNCQVIQYMHWDQVFTEPMPAHNLRMRSLLQTYSLHKFPNQVRNDNLSKQKTKVGARPLSVFVSVMMKSAEPHAVH